MKVKLLILTLLVIGGYLVYSYLIRNSNQLVGESTDAATQTPIPTPTSAPIAELSSFQPIKLSAGKNPYKEIFDRDGQVAFSGPKLNDLTGDDKPEKIYTTYGEGCVSCHAQNIYVFSSDQLLLKIETDDPNLNYLSGRGLVLVEPIRDGEPYCCPTKFKTFVFLWNGDKFNISLGDQGQSN